jgi:hypothetical protein
MFETGSLMQSTEPLLCPDHGENTFTVTLEIRPLLQRTLRSCIDDRTVGPVAWNLFNTISGCSMIPLSEIKRPRQGKPIIPTDDDSAYVGQGYDLTPMLFSCNMFPRESAFADYLYLFKSLE